MTLTFASLKDSIYHALGGDPARGASYGRIINGAGRSWTAAAEWYYLNAREVTLSTVAGEEYIALPADYLKLSKIVRSANFGVSIQILTPSQFVEVAQSGYGNVIATYAVTVVHRTISGASAPWLRVYPVPAAVESFIMLYDARWAEINDDDDVVPIPDYCEHIFDAWTCAYALGLEEGDAASVQVRLAALKQSDMFMDVVRTDALTTGAVIPLGMGAAGEQWSTYTRVNHPGNLV